MSLARRALARKLAGQAFDFAGRKAMIEAGEAVPGPIGEIESAIAHTTPAAAGVVGKTVRTGSPALRHVMKKAAANDDIVQDGSENLTPYDQMCLKLHQDRVRLKGLQSTELKVALKRELLPTYSPWILGRLEAAAGGKRAAQDDVMVAMMVWAIDVGDYKLALELAEYCDLNDMVLPPNFKRSLPAYVTEEIATAALDAYRAAGDKPCAFPGGILGDVEELFRDHDMFDQIRAKLQKAIGLAILNAIPVDSAPDDRLTVQKSALGFFKRASELDSASGCVKLIEGIERALKKAEPAA